MPSTADAALLPLSIISPDDLPRPAISERDLGTLALLRALRTNGLATYSARTYTETRVHRRLLGRDFFWLSDLDDIDHVLNRHMDRYRRDPLGRRILEPTVGRGVLLAEGAEWRRQRHSLASAFQPRYVDRLIPGFHDEATRRIARWNAEGVQSRNLLVDFRALTLAIAARAMFSIEDDRRTAQLADLMNEGERQKSFLHWRDFLFLLLGRGVAQPSVRRAFGERWRGWMISFLEDRPPLAQLDEARDLLDLLRTARDQSSGGPFQAEAIVDQVGTMMVAGFETTAIALFWIALLLAFFPNQQEAIRGELCAQSVDAPPEAQFLRSLPTTTAFVYETLRLYPPIYNLSRQAAVDDRIGDLSIPRGATISISPWVLHRHQRHWDRPHRFDPRRFVRDGRIAVPKAWMPFGAGPRICIGMAFATTEIFTVLRILLAHYRIALQGQAPQPVGRVALLPAFEPSFKLLRL
ncbi:MAG TPA: cytochrome P450 [Xanthobacteraceae bacterium]|nr:cytochrome P450 [Xanthobacteraceae bacterium]